VRQWGIEIIALDFERIDYNIEIAKRMNKAAARDEETLEKKTEAEREATRIRLTGAAQAEAEAKRVMEMVKALKDSGIDLSPDVLREIVIDAIHAATEANLDHNTLRL
jgi:regulator of protease activity HflC (stomatin/prohibitin superfamily)